MNDLLTVKKLVVGLAVLFCVVAYGSARDPSNFFYRISPANAPLKKEPIFYAPRPKYPVEAQKNHWEGVGLFEIHIRSDGRVEFVKILKSIGHSILDQAAIETLSQWRFRPKSLKVVRMPIEYTMEPFRGASGKELKDLGDGDTAVIIGHSAY